MGTSMSAGSSSAVKRWMTLSNAIMKRKGQEMMAIQAEEQFLIFEAVTLPEVSCSGRWYRVNFTAEDKMSVEVHIYAAHNLSLNELIGFNNTGNIRLWLSEECLAHFLIHHRTICFDKTVLELGAGMVGLAGLAAAKLGAREVVLTDGNSKSVENMQVIIEKNRMCGKLSSTLLKWDQHIGLRKSFDRIICADCLFFSAEHEALLSCTYSHLESGGVAYFMAPDRHGTAKRFLNCIYNDSKKWKSVEVIFRLDYEQEFYSKLNDLNCDQRFELNADVQKPILIVLRK